MIIKTRGSLPAFRWSILSLEHGYIKVKVFIFNLTNSAGVTAFLNLSTSTIYQTLRRYLSTFITHDRLEVFQRQHNKSANDSCVMNYHTNRQAQHKYCESPLQYPWNQEVHNTWHFDKNRKNLFSNPDEHWTDQRGIHFSNRANQHSFNTRPYAAQMNSFQHQSFWWCWLWCLTSTEIAIEDGCKRVSITWPKSL